MTKTKRGKQNTRNSANGPSPDAVVWNGNVRDPSASVASDAIVARLSYVGTALGGTGGIGQAVNNVTVSTVSDWAGYAATYDEYRVLGMELDYLPNYPGGNSAVVHAAGFGVTTHSTDSFVSPSVDSLVQRSNWRPFYTSVAYKEQWHMASIEEAGFVSTAQAGTAPLLGTIALFAPGATTASSYGYFVGTFAVQFRGRK